MNTTATALDITWNEPSRGNNTIPVNWVRPIVEARPHLRCPGCQTVIYSRRHKLCGVCSQELPSELLFTDSQALQVNELLRVERDRHRAWMKRERSW